MDKLNVTDLRNIFKQAELTVYEVDAPDNIDGFKFSTIEHFVDFLKRITNSEKVPLCNYTNRHFCRCF